MKKLYIIPLLLLIVTTAFSQGSLRGHVIDASTQVITGVYVYLDGTNYFSQTDLQGDFEIHGIPAGEYQLMISFIGYENIEQTVSIENGTTVFIDIKMDESKLLQEIVINGRLEGQAKALNAQKNSLNITEMIAYEQIERFPDANMGDALKRLSGVNVQYDQGEARFANIRGTAPELNSITINGERIPSAEAEERFVQLDLIPADVINSVELSKAVTPDMDADAIGGSINLVLQKAPEEERFRGTLGTGYSFLTEEPQFKGLLSYSNRFADGKLGLMLTASALDRQIRSDNIEAEWDFTDENNKDGSAFTETQEIRQYELQRFRQSYSATLDYEINNNHSLFIEGMYNRRKDWENRYRVEFKDIDFDEDEESYIAEIVRQTKGGNDDTKDRRLEDQVMQRFGGGGEHIFNQWKVNWSLTSLKASEDRPNERYIGYKAEGVPINLNVSDKENPRVSVPNPDFADLSSEYEFDELTEEFQYTEEEDLNARLDFERPILTGANASFIKFGARFKSKEKFRDNSFFEYEAEDEDAFDAQALSNTIDKTQNNFSIDGYESGSYVDEVFLSGIDLTSGFESEADLGEFAGNFNSKEQVIGGYLMYTQQIGNEWVFLGGFRVEQTTNEYSGQRFDGEELTETDLVEADYTNVLPGLHVRYSPGQWTNVKAAWTNTIARPNYFDLVPYREIELEDNEIAIGNPLLEATESMNIDLMVEHFFKNIGILSGGIFYKNLTNVIATKSENDVDFEGNVYDVFSQPLNTGDADLIGFELGLQRRLDFLPGAFSNLTFYGNYTYTKSELKNITIEDREDKTLPLVGTPENTFNVSLAYDAKRLDIRLSYNYAGAFIEEYNDEAFFDRWYDVAGYLDFNLDYQLNDKWKIYTSVNNITDQPLHFYQGVEERTMQSEFYGIQARLGVKFDL